MSHCADGSTERDGTYITLLPSCAYYSVLLLTPESDAIACNTSLAPLTEEEIAADVINASAMEEGSDNDLDEPQESS